MFQAYDIQLHRYPTPVNLSYAWSFGSLAGTTMALQVFSGVCAMSYYVADGGLVGEVLETAIRDSDYGWFVRDVHANVPSALFAWLYAHQARSVLVGTRAVWAWMTGWLVFLLTVVVSFLGYSCVWGQMSYWAATVITSLVTVCPGGVDLLACLWGGPTLGTPTLTRFIALHYGLALLTLALAGVHVIAVHYVGSSNPLATAAVDKVPFMAYFPLKDACAAVVASVAVTAVACGLPTVTMDVEMYQAVNTMSTPEHIVPEWYLLAFYAVLRCIPSKPLGVLLLAVVFFLLLLVPVKDSYEAAR